MKKSTVIMIAMAVISWVILLGIIAYEYSTGVPYAENSIVIEEGAPCFSLKANRFNAIEVPSPKNTKMELYSDSFAGIRINVCDTATAVTVSAPEQLRRYLTCENTGDTLRVYLQIPPEDTVKKSPRYAVLRVLKSPVPITVTTPDPFSSVFAECAYPISINNLSSDSLGLLLQNHISLNDSRINNIKIKALWHNRVSLGMKKCEINNITPASSVTSVNLSGDSLTSVNELILDNDKKNAVSVVAKNIRINSISVPNTSLDLSARNSTVKNISSK